MITLAAIFAIFVVTSLTLTAALVIVLGVEAHRAAKSTPTGRNPFARTNEERTETAPEPLKVMHKLSCITFVPPTR